MIRWAQWDVAARNLATPVDARGAIDRLSAPVRGAGFWLALWAAAVGAEFAALIPVIWPGEEPVETVQVIYRLIGGSFAACGLIAWRRRPDSRSGLLMAGAGVGFFLSAIVGQVDTPIAQTASILVQEMWAPFFVALLLTLLTGGRLASRVDWLLVGAFVLALWVLQLVWLLFYEQDGNLLAAFPNADIAAAVDKGQRTLAGLACVAVAIVVAARWMAASRPRRRALLPSVAGSVALLLFAALLTNDIVTGSRSQTALAAGPRRRGRPLSRPQDHERRGAAGRPGQGARRSEPRGRLPPARVAGLRRRRRPLGVGAPDRGRSLQRGRRERRHRDRRPRLRRLARRRSRTGRRRARGGRHGARERAPARGGGIQAR
jgi:hypothetical protein